LGPENGWRKVKLSLLEDDFSKNNVWWAVGQGWFNENTIFIHNVDGALLFALGVRKL